MSTEALKQIIGRAVTEPEYRELLLTDLAQALEGYDLTEDEVSALKSLSRENFDATASALDERISRAGLDWYRIDPESPGIKGPFVKG